MLKVSAPGKLFLSGEWAILEIGNPGIVAAVNKNVYVEIEKSDCIEVSLDDFGIKNARADFDGTGLEWKDVTEEAKERLMFVKAAIEATLRYLGTTKPFRMRSWGDTTNISVEGVQKKVGFGSSAAAVVATVAAILAFDGQDIADEKGKERVYKLSTIAHYLAQGKVGSAFDVAASTYGGAFVYKRFDPEWLMEQLASKSVKEVVEQEWKGFSVKSLSIPQGFDLSVGWTKESASTSAMVKEMNKFKQENPEEYRRLYDSIAALVKECIDAWNQNNSTKVLELLRKNEDLLRELGEKSGLPIETADLKKLSTLANEAGAAGKLSGAGGGDCGIAISFDQSVSDKVKEAWKQNGFYLIDTTVSREGVRVEQE